MQSDPFPTFEYLTQTQLGKMYGTSSVAVGQWLKQVGLRLPNGSPSPKAIDGCVGRNFSPDGSSQGFWVWRKDVIAKVFEAAGHRRPMSEAPQDVNAKASSACSLDPVDRILFGPFEITSCGDEGEFNICGATGEIGIRVRGEVLAKRIAVMLNGLWISKKWFSET